MTKNPMITLILTSILALIYLLVSAACSRVDDK